MSAQAGRRPILLVEDNPMDVDLTLRAFRRRGMAIPIDVARDGEEALARIAAWEAGEPLPRVVLLDLKLPKVDGLEVLRRYRAHARLASVPIVVLSTSAEASDTQAAHAFGATDYIVKPVGFVQFLEIAGRIETTWCRIDDD